MPANATRRPASTQVSLCALVDQVRALVEYQRSTGVDWIPRSGTATVAPQDAPGAPPAAAEHLPSGSRPDNRPPVAAAVARSGDLFAPAPVRRATNLDDLRAEIGDCRRCKLCSGRTHLVFGVGDPNADLMFVGEGPGRDEDLQGEPFVGRAGKLLTEIITKGMKRRREDVYIANVIKCRPPNNRNPEPEEVAACRPFLERQIEIVAPRVIVALGTFAAQTLLGVRTPISRLRGQWHDLQGIRLMPTLHPAYLLRNPTDKRLVWEDIKMVIAELGGTP